MNAKRLFALTLAVFVLIYGNAVDAQPLERARVEDHALGIAFNAAGSVEKNDSSTYGMILQSAHLARVLVSVGDRLFVDLPGTYGGRLYLDTPSASGSVQDRVLVDTVKTAGREFSRQYWIVYAGMGMWEGVINCYTEEGGRYYIVSLIQDRPFGKPGEEVDGRYLDGGVLKERFLASLRDTTNENVRQFNTLLGSFQIQNQ
jgi:hypothetical protein